MKQLLSIMLILLLTAAALAVPAQASAVSPPNDDFSAASVISSLPFQETLDTTTATTASDDPDYSCAFRREATVWYAFTPSQDVRLDASTAGSSYATTVTVYTGWRGALNQVECGFSQVSLAATANQTYYFMVAADRGAYPSPGDAGGALEFSVRLPPPPPNDQFASATAATSLPFSDPVDMASASMELDEPTPSCNSAAVRSVWYAFTPAVSGSYSASFGSGDYWWSRKLAIYTGSALVDLRELRCGGMSIEPLTIRMEAGVTYYYQLTSSDPGQTAFYLDVAPAPQTTAYYYPSDPSSFDTIQCINASYDPAGVGFQSWEWNFGDGTTSSEYNPEHRYAKDGDYTLQLTATTFDGRSASASQPVQVKTHDVAIAKFSAPQAASAGQTRQIAVGLNSKHYPESVQVQLFKSIPGGLELLGSLTQTVPVRPANRSTGFSFSYTFTSADASIGKVTFKAIATIIGARDVLPADNEASATPTKVGKR